MQLMPICSGGRELTPPLFSPCYATPVKINVNRFDNYVQ